MAFKLKRAFKGAASIVTSGGLALAKSKTRERKLSPGGTAISGVAKERANTFDFKFKRRKNLLGKRTRSRRERTSETITKSAITQTDFEKLINFNVLSDDFNDVKDIKATTSTFQKRSDTGEIFRKGEELSILDQEGFDKILQSISGRRAQIEGQALAPGLNRQAFSLLSGNFS